MGERRVRREGERGEEGERGDFSNIFKTIHIPSYTFIYLYIPSYTPNTLDIPSYTIIYLIIFKVKNMRTNIRLKNGHISGPRAFPRVRI